MKKEEKKKGDEKDYCLTINFYRWEFLRRSKEYQKFYKRLKKEYLIPLKKFEADLKEQGLTMDKIHTGRLSAKYFNSPSDLVKQKRTLQNAHNVMSEEVYNKFGLSWFLMEKHYPKEMLNPNKKISKDAVIFTDYQRYSPCYEDFVFHPHIKRITDMPSSDFERFRALNPSHEIFAISTWGENDISDKAIEVIAEIIKETFKNHPKKPFIKNPFLLDQCEPIRGRTLGLQAKKLSEHWADLLKTWDLFEKAMMKESTQGMAMNSVADKLNISFEAVRSRIRQSRKLISEANQGRFYTPTQDIS